MVTTNVSTSKVTDPEDGVSSATAAAADMTKVKMGHGIHHHYGFHHHAGSDTSPVMPGSLGADHTGWHGMHFICTAIGVGHGGSSTTASPGGGMSGGSAAAEPTHASWADGMAHSHHDWTVPPLSGSSEASGKVEIGGQWMMDHRAATMGGVMPASHS
jgi:hypothetical protein